MGNCDTQALPPREGENHLEGNASGIRKTTMDLLFMRRDIRFDKITERSKGCNLEKMYKNVSAKNGKESCKKFIVEYY